MLRHIEEGSRSVGVFRGRSQRPRLLNVNKRLTRPRKRGPGLVNEEDHAPVPPGGKLWRRAIASRPAAERSACCQEGRPRPQEARCVECVMNENDACLETCCSCYINLLLDGMNHCPSNGRPDTSEPAPFRLMMACGAICVANGPTPC